MPFDELPSMLNPERGYIVTANNPVSGRRPDARPRTGISAIARAPSSSSSTSASPRARSSRQTTSAEIQLDTADANASTLLPVIAELDLDGDAARGAALLDGWDGHADVDSAEAAYFAVFWRNLLDDMFGSLPDETASGGRRPVVRRRRLAPRRARRPLVDERGRGGRRTRRHDRAPRSTTRGARHPTAWAATPTDGAGAACTRSCSPTRASASPASAPIEWLFNRGPYELGGGSSIVNAIGWDASVGYGVDWVPSMRMIVDLDDFDASTWVNLTGASGHAFHPHYADQAPLWQRGETRAWPFTTTAVQDAATDTLQLNPAG